MGWSWCNTKMVEGGNKKWKKSRKFSYRKANKKVEEMKHREGSIAFGLP
jgi:hypothetical protein